MKKHKGMRAIKVRVMLRVGGAEDCVVGIGHTEGASGVVVTRVFDLGGGYNGVYLIRMC